LSTKHSYAELILVNLEEELRGSVGAYTCTCKIVLHLSLFLFLRQGATTRAACGTSMRYGRVDIVVNNAGILRDVSFKRMSEKDPGSAGCFAPELLKQHGKYYIDGANQ